VGVGLVITLVALSALGVGGLGFVAGRATAPDSVEQVEGLVLAQSAQLEAQGRTLAELAEAASRPVVIDAEIRETLAETPPQCRQGQDPVGLACAWATCLQYGQSSANRPECRAIEAAYLSSMAQPAE
jgi:hypothetical protein